MHTYVDFYIYPWLNGDTNVSNFSAILNNRVTALLVQNNLSPTQCIADSIESQWYVDLKIGTDTVIHQLFYTGYGSTDVPTNRQWRNALIAALPSLYDYGFTYFLNGNNLRITTLTCEPRNLQEIVSLNTGIMIDINCNTN